MIRLGDKVIDKITGFEGVAIAKIEFLNGCVQFEVIPKVKKCAVKIEDGSYVDEQRLIKIPEKVTRVKSERVGGGFRNYPIH